MDLEIWHLLDRLTRAKDDPLAPVWRYVAKSYEELDCRRTLCSALAILVAHQQGRLARARGNSSLCPYAAGERGANDGAAVLHRAWLAGYEPEPEP